MANFKYSHFHTLSGGTITANDLQMGEIALNLKKGEEKLYFKNANEELQVIGVGVSYTKDESDTYFATGIQADESDKKKFYLVNKKGATIGTLDLKDFWTSTEIQSAISSVVTAAVDEIEESLDEIDTEIKDINTALGNVYTKEEADAEHKKLSDEITTLSTTVNGKVDQTEYDAYTAATEETLATFFDGASYNSTTKKIEFKNGEDVKASIDASPFIKDGMLESAEITGGTGDNTGKTVLKLAFNTDAGTDDIEIDIADIFDADNYYTKEEADAEHEELEGMIDAVSDDVETISGNVITTASAAINSTDGKLNLTLAKQTGDPISAYMNVFKDNETGIMLAEGTTGTIVLKGGTF